MKICVYGAGAIGGHLAMRLVKGGADVSVVARGPHLAAIRQNGLVVRTRDGEHRASVRASDDPAALGEQDAVLVTVKAPALPSVARGIGPLLKQDTGVAFIMNGLPWWYFQRHGGKLDGQQLRRLDPDGAMANAVAAERVIGGIVNSPSEVIAPGVVNVERETNYVTLGEPDGTISPRIEAITRVLRAGGIDAGVTADIRTAIWNKLIGNLMTGPLSVLAQSDYQRTLADPACLKAARQVVSEATAVAQALGCKPDLDADKRLASSMRLPHRPSILQDLELGRPMEVDGIYVAATELARLANVPTPTLDLLVGLVKLRASSAGLYTG